MELPLDNYTLDSFHAYLRTISRQYSQQLKLVCLVTYFPGTPQPDCLQLVEELFRRRNFDVRRKGAVSEFSTFLIDAKTREKISIRLYGYLTHHDQVLKCFTTDKTDLLDQALRSVVNARGIYYLWINPVTFEELKDKLLSYPGTSITNFTASRVASTKFPSHVRPSAERTVIYYGDDGEETLQELKYQYGVIPDVIRFDVPHHADLQISRKGIFIYNGGQFEFVNEASDTAIELALRSKAIFDASRVSIISLNTARKSFELNQFTPWIIEFGREINPDDLEKLFSELQTDKFAIYNSIILKGSLHGEGTVLDEIYRTIFTLTIDNNRVIISPRYDTSSESFLRFFRTIADRFDPNAKALAPVDL